MLLHAARHKAFFVLELGAFLFTFALSLQCTAAAAKDAR